MVIPCAGRTAAAGGAGRTTDGGVWERGDPTSGIARRRDGTRPEKGGRETEKAVRRGAGAPFVAPAWRARRARGFGARLQKGKLQHPAEHG